MTEFLEDLVKCLEDTVRFKSDGNPEFANHAMTDSVTKPASARLIYHPLLTEENLRSIAPNFNQFVFNAWDNSKTYSIGDRVSYSISGVDYIWESNIDSNTGNTPGGTTNDWDVISLFSEWLEDVRSDGIRNTVTSLFNAKRDKRQTKTLLDNLTLYDQPARNSQFIVKRDRVVGFEIELVNTNSLIGIIEAIGVQFTQVQTGLTLRLHHSSQLETVAEIDIDVNRKISLNWIQNGIKGNLKPFSYDEYGGGIWYLTYREDELLGQAVNHKNYWGKPPCRSCSSSSYNNYQEWSKYIRVRAISLEDGDYDKVNNELWDLEKVKYHPSDTFGLNLRISVQCELSTLLCSKKEILGETIAQQITVDLLREIANNTRSNTFSEKTRELARIAIANDDLGGENEIKKLEKANEALNFEFSDLHSRVCMPCLPSKGVSYKSVGGSSGDGGRYAFYR